MLTITINIEAETPAQAQELAATVVRLFSNDGAIAFQADQQSVTVKKPSSRASKDKLPLEAPVPADKPTEEPTNPDPVEEQPAEPAKEEKPKTTAKRGGGRKRKADTPASEASPAATANSSPVGLRNEAARQLAEHFGTRKPGKALKDLLAKYDATTAMDVPDTRAAEFLADVKAMVGGAAVEASEPTKEEPKKISEQIAEDLGI